MKKQLLIIERLFKVYALAIPLSPLILVGGLFIGAITCQVMGWQFDTVFHYADWLDRLSESTRMMRDSQPRDPLWLRFLLGIPSIVALVLFYRTYNGFSKFIRQIRLDTLVSETTAQILRKIGKTLVQLYLTGIVLALIHYRTNLNFDWSQATPFFFELTMKTWQTTSFISQIFPAFHGAINLILAAFAFLSARMIDEQLKLNKDVSELKQQAELTI